MGHQGTLGIVTEATLELVTRPEAEFAPSSRTRTTRPPGAPQGSWPARGSPPWPGVVLFDEWKIDYLRRDDEAYIPQPPEVKAVVATAMYGVADEVRPAAKRLLRIGLESGGTYLGDEISQGDWASRHDRYATPLHGRVRNGQVVPMSWHCEDASINFSALPAVREEWHAIVDRLRERHDMFDDWGMFAYTNAAYKPWGDYLTEIDVGIWEERWDEDSWQAWVEAKRDIAAVALKPRRVDQRLPRLVPRGRGRPGAGGAGRRLRGHEVDQAGARPEQRHEPRQVPARPGLRGGRVIGFRLAAQRPPEARRVTDVVVMRFDDVYEVDPALMTEHVQQQEIPAWDTERIVDSRWEHLAWMHDHFADSVVSGEELITELDAEG